ncbi:MAG: hypothetical protein OXG04_18345 [Acidobacteria bacterium]|nr:hypothetical protein [Acidobacteriota bacterium]
MRTIEVGIEDVNRIQTSLESLTPTEFAALRVLDSRCRILWFCAFFSLQPSPATACPAEYEKYEESIQEVQTVLRRTETLRHAVSEACAKADALSDAREDVAELENSAGATGGRRTILQQRARLAENEFLGSLKDVQARIEELSVPHSDLE